LAGAFFVFQSPGIALLGFAGIKMLMRSSWDIALHSDPSRGAETPGWGDA